jgi:hypothetical protein
MRIKLLLLVALLASVFACSSDSDPVQKLSGPWEVKGVGLEEGLTIQLPGGIPTKSPKGLTLQREFVLEPEVAVLEELWVYLTYPDIPLKIYINDHYLYTRGVYENGTYFVPTVAAECVFSFQRTS